MGQGALSKPVVQWWLSLNSSTLPPSMSSAGGEGYNRPGSRKVQISIMRTMFGPRVART